MKKILGLDLGTNSIGWALIDQNFTEKQGEILGLGSRIIPMDQGTLGEFERGNSVSQTKERTGFRSVRRLRERHLLRRARLHRVLNILGFLPEHFAKEIDFEKKLGQFRNENEPLLAYNSTGPGGKSEFLFRDSFQEMMMEFAGKHPGLAESGKRVPYDWTLYFLRKKALTKKISKEELAWLLLNFNQKRGYFQLRGEEETENANKLVEFHALRVVDVVDSGDRKGKDEVWYNVILENGWVYRRTSKIPLDWTGKVKEFVVSTDLNDDGSIKTDKEGNEKRSFRAPLADDWTLIKKKTEFEIEQSRKTVGCFIYDALLQNPAQKIRGKLVRTVERKFYKEELIQILEKQAEFHDELKDRKLYAACTQDLYRKNETHRKGLAGKDFNHLFINDIIFYQRPLKSKKSLISNCRYESRIYLSKDDVKVVEPVKCIAKSHPLFQEFRLWQFLQNLRIYRKNAMVNGLTVTDLDVTSEFLKSEDDWVALFDWLNDRREIKQETFLKYPPFNLKRNAMNYRWNYVEDKVYPANETRSMMLVRLGKITENPEKWLTGEIAERLWHILYSVDDKIEIEKALNTFANKHELGSEFAEAFKNFPPYKNEYGAYSAKAIRKLLPLMRRGKYWQPDEIDPHTKNRIGLISERLESIGNDPKKIADITDDDIPKQVLKSFIECKNPLQALNTYQACYAVYGRHSEEGEIICWKNPQDIDRYLKNVFRQHSLRNPIVEKVIAETLRIVRDIWNHYGSGVERYFDEIHVEMGREMKNPADKRKKMSDQVTDNENTNLRIKALLMEMSLDPEIEDVRPYSPAQQDILKIYEDGVLSSGLDIPEDILKISKNAQPSKAELLRYKLWLEQKYRSPYTGEIIPLGKLFTPAYEIEHIIPQSRYFDDSFTNKVVCETEVNKDKDNCTGFEYIKANSGKIMELGMGKRVKLFTLDAYQDFVTNHYTGNRGKMKRLLMDDIPEGFIARQLNDTRYISKVVKNLLSNVVREEGEEETTSKHVCASNGTITTVLKRDWGLNDVWNQLVSPRFIRLNQMTNSNQFGEWMSRGGNQVFQTRVPLEFQKGFSKKRIDHRHHAMDALVIACATRNHINYLNNFYAKSEVRHDLRSTLCFKDKSEGNGNYQWTFSKPWDGFTKDALDKLESIIVTFKQNNRVINKTVNRYQKWEENDEGKLHKVFVKQEKGDHWAIRKPMHKDTVAGEVSLKIKKQVSLSVALDSFEMIVNRSLKRKVLELRSAGLDKKLIIKYFKDNDYKLGDLDVSRVEVYFIDCDNVATRVSLDEKFDVSAIAGITDTGIRKILLNHLNNYKEEKEGRIIEHPELAFSPDGVDELNRNIQALNDGKEHKPIYKVRKFEPKGNKFNVGYRGNKKTKFVEAAKGTNLFFAIYADKDGKRSYESVPLNVVIERLKQGLTVVPNENENGFRLLFVLSPNDLVYIMTREEKLSPLLIGPKNFTDDQRQRIYKIVSFTGARLYAVPNSVASVILDKVEFTQLNKIEFIPDKISIKENCVRIATNRLGKLIDHDKKKQ